MGKKSRLFVIGRGIVGDSILVLPMLVAMLQKEAAEGSSGREQSMPDKAVCSFGICSIPDLCTKRDLIYSPSCMPSTIWGEVTIVPGKVPGGSVRKGLNVEVC